jgi:subtilisin family serine protease
MALNPYLAAKLKTANLGPEMIPLLVEVESPQVASQLAKIMGLGGATIKVGRTIGLPGTTQYIEVSAPVESLADIEQTPGVIMVHKNMIKKATALPSVLSKLMTQIDPIEGEVSIDSVIMPRELLGPSMALRYSPLGLLTRTPLGKIGPLAQMSPLGEITIIPTSQSRLVLLDVPTDYDGSGITVAVLDTGSGPQLPQSLGVLGYSACQADPLPTDQHGHGSWCLTAATGRRAKGIFGEVQGVAPGAGQMPIKVLQSLTGMGMTADILAGIQMAVDKGAQVISLSLGSDSCQGGCYQSDGGPCPECKLIKQLSDQGILFVIAAGNSGTDPAESWQIGCPGCAKGAITVASLSMTDTPATAYWSSVGPSSPDNKGNAGFEPKPTCCAPGGGRASSKDTPDEVLYSGMGGYFTGLYTGVWTDIAGNFHGTSQATPHIAGLLAVLLQAGKIANARDFKAICARMGHSYQSTDGYGIPKLSWFQ